MFTAQVVENEQIMPATNVLTLHDPRAARSASPGQFLHIRCGDDVEPLLRRPMSIYRSEGDTIQLMIRNVGEGSRWLVNREPGDMLDVIGPMGHGFKLDPRAANVLMVGGGYGVAPLVGLAERAIAKGIGVAVAVGAATGELVFPTRLLPPEVEYLVATDDGTAGYKGYVTDLVPERLSWADVVYACGPIAMMEALARIMKSQAPRKRGQVAMEERMGCAMGVCLGCCIDTNKGPERVCTEGPVFDIQRVVWRDEAPRLGRVDGHRGAD
jgi:dihydroorotate dehydrogenase electron transfer subunit